MSDVENRVRKWSNSEVASDIKETLGANANLSLLIVNEEGREAIAEAARRLEGEGRIVAEGWVDEGQLRRLAEGGPETAEVREKHLMAGDIPVALYRRHQPTDEGEGDDLDD